MKISAITLLLLGVVASCNHGRAERCRMLREAVQARAAECGVSVPSEALTCGEGDGDASARCVKDTLEDTCARLFGDKASWRSHKRTPVDRVELPQSCSRD